MLLLPAVGAWWTASAQSGRRAPKPAVPAPTPELPAPTPAPTPKPKPKPEFFFKIVTDYPLGVYQRLAFPERAGRWFAERLEKSLRLEIRGTVSGNRREAKKLAEASTEEYVIYFGLDEDAFAAGGAAGGDLRINFSVLEPKTGKSRQNGASYLKPELLGGTLDRRRYCHPELTDLDYLLLEASHEAAGRVLNGFNLPAPPEKCGRLPG